MFAGACSVYNLKSGCSKSSMLASSIFLVRKVSFFYLSAFLLIPVLKSVGF